PLPHSSPPYIHTLSLHDALPISFCTAAASSSSDSLMPIETPQAISSRTPPMSLASGTPFCLASASQTAASSEPLAILCPRTRARSEEHTSELQSRENLVCRLLLE